MHHEKLISADEGVIDGQFVRSLSTNNGESRQFGGRKRQLGLGFNIWGLLLARPRDLKASFILSLGCDKIQY
jgi:hypothetical protein